MAFSFVQSKSTTGTEPLSPAYTSSVTAGHLLVAVAAWNSSSATCSVSDNVNGSWTAVGSPQTGSGGLASWRLQLFYKTGAAAGATTVTADVSSSVELLFAIHEYGGTSPAIDGTPVYNAVQGDPATSSAITTTAAGDLLFAACITVDQVNNPGGGYTQREHANFGLNSTEDILNAGVAGTYTAEFDVQTGTDDNIIGFIAFKEGGAAATSYPIRRRSNAHLLMR